MRCTNIRTAEDRSHDRHCNGFCLAVVRTQPASSEFHADLELSGLAGIPISGQLAGKYGYLALSIYAGTSNIVGGTLLAAARFKQQKTLCAVI